LDETIWSLTSPRAKRISGSKNFLQQYLPKDDVNCDFKHSML
jgi:hypothetical protein